MLGECRDRAGNATQRSFALKFDGNPPGVSNLKLMAGDRRLDLSWATTADVASVEVARTPGVGTAAPSVVFGGPGTSFRDERVENGVRYTYEVTVRDLAGNRASTQVTGTPVAPPPPTPVATPTSPTPPASGQSPRSRRLLAPLPGATIDMAHPPMFRWVAVKRARYYNFQLYLNGRKRLTAWTARPQFQLRRTWTFAGKRQRLLPGHYRWIVWPGFGPRSRADYGKPIGRSDFVVKR